MNFRVGDVDIFTFEQRIFHIILVFSIVISAISTILYYVLQQNMALIAVGGVSFLLSFSLYILSAFFKRYQLAKFLLLSVTGIVFIPLIWILNNGIRGWAPYLVIMFSSLLSLMLRGVKRLAAIAGFFCVVGWLIFIDAKNFTTHAVSYLGTVSSMVIFSLFFILLLEIYIDEKKRTAEFSSQIEKKNLEVQMARLDRLNIIGEMAASIGHEVRNPMTTVRGYLQFFLMKPELGKYDSQIQTMIEELDRANSIISEFLSLAKNKRLTMKRGNLNDILQALFPLLQADALHLGHDLLLQTEPLPDNEFDEKEIRQLILNLVRNAFEAMDSKGIVKINTSFTATHTLLSISDSGKGIPTEVASKLGTPFVTTKNNGTGLGLAVCYQIVNRHKAIIDFTTGDKGTTFTVSFLNCQPGGEGNSVL